MDKRKIVAKGKTMHYKLVDGKYRSMMNQTKDLIQL